MLVGHGCDGSATNQVRVTVPAGFQGAKPMPKPGWNLSTKSGKLATPYDNGHGGMVTEGVSEVTWVATSKDSVLPDAQFDELYSGEGCPKRPDRCGSRFFRDAKKAVLTGLKYRQAELPPKV